MKEQAVLTTNHDPAQIARLNHMMQQAGQAANETAARYAFEDHIARKAGNTVRRKIADLELFETFLRSAGVPNAFRSQQEAPGGARRGTPRDYVEKCGLSKLDLSMFIP